MIYTYVWSSSETISSKGGTFVEGIFDNTSYLPYLRMDDQSIFYQGLLFNSCLKYVVDDKGGSYKPDLCDIKTDDDQTYLLSFSGNAIWSDGTPLSMDDIAFTYDTVIIKNKWNLKHLTMYKDIKISRENPNQIKLIFPTSSVDNKLFFTNYILPQHIIQNFDLQQYRDIFSAQPTYTNCANIVPQTSDQYSLIFNLLNCKDSHLNFYQIKNLVSFENFSTNGKSAKNSIVDAYLGGSPLSGYSSQKLMTNKLISVFFNTNSDRLRVRTRRALGGLIKRNFYTTGYQDYVIKNTDGLFDVFLSTGTNIKDYLTATDSNTINKKDLMDSGIKPLSGTIAVNGTNQKFVYLIEQQSTTKSLSFNFSDTYDTIALEYKGKTFYDKGYSSKNKKASFSLGSISKLDEGLNKYIIRGWQKGKKITVATVDLYNIIPQTTTSGATIVPMTVLYFNSPMYLPIVNNLKTIFSKADIGAYFTFKGIDDSEEFQNTLLLGDYDISINTIDMGQRKDITKIFATDSAKINPSQYQNKNLISILQEYTISPQAKLLNQINDIYAKDMPFVILGKVFVPIHIKQDLVDKLFPNPDIQLYDFNWRSVLYNNLELVNNIHIDGKRVWDSMNFIRFIKSSLGIAETQVTTRSKAN